MSTNFSQDAVPKDKKGIPFAIESVDEDRNSGSGDSSDSESGDGSNSDIYFAPEYYPKRLTQTTNNSLKRDNNQCGGEDVTLDNTKNSEFHVTGIVLAKNLSELRNLSNYQGRVDLLSPIAGNGGVECVMKKIEIGEIVGWDSFENQWQFSYTLDLVSTGTDEGEQLGENQIVSEIVGE